MQPPTEKQAVAEIVNLLADLFEKSPETIRQKKTNYPNNYDFSLSIQRHRFFVEYKTSASAGTVATALNRLKQIDKKLQKEGIPLLVVPYMGQVGQDLCERATTSWLDLSGNAKIVARGIRIWIEGRPNKYKDRGRPSNIFAPKSSRVTRQLLLWPQKFQTQSDIAQQAGLDDGYVSKIVKRLEKENYVEANEKGAIRPRDPNVLLDAWNESYDFRRHRIVEGHVPSRTGEELLQKIASHFSNEKLDYAATGLCAAWKYTSFAMFRLVTVYLRSTPSRRLFKELTFSDEPRGANLWLVFPEDDGVFDGRQLQGSIRCVSPVQTYLDLKAQPERAQDAAAELRQELLNWGQHGN